ncbi:hypothetical protein FK178_03380 [Antarcticibacterium arcticum]|uniref:Fibronectin type-III domain-containing protein n=1 Tax=Antarcticibacterium arcticum TaxID=2585771 RepID=A0A5B8YFU0_9FLAO|nr:hypothetical protein [Antarcticibacterium arcticum]QED36810.1 hypothetical protein FK178_03380 [Antarcticibacterium arcticum]
MKKYSYFIIIFLLISCNTDENEISSPSILIIEIDDVSINQASFKIKIEDIPNTEFVTGIFWDSIPNQVKENNYVIVDLEQDEGIGTIRGLESNRTYYARAFLSYNSMTIYSNEEKFTTKSIEVLCENIYKYDIEHDERASVVRETNDGGFLVCGWTNPSYGNNHNYFDLVLLKYNANCEILWEKLIPGHLIVHNLIEEPNGNILLLTNKNFGHPVIYKMDSEGNIIWTKGEGYNIYGGNLKDIIVTKDGEYGLIGTYSIDSEQRFGWFVKLNSNGEIILEKSFPKSDMMIGKSIIQSEDRGFYVVGDLQYESTFLYKLNNEGEIEWRKHIGKVPSDLNRSILATSDNKLLISGSTRRLGPDKENLWLVKLDLDGNIIWENGIGKEKYLFSVDGNDSPTEIIQSNSGFLYMTGGGRFYPREGTPTTQSNIWVFKISPVDGQLIWSKEFGSNELYTWDLSYSIIELHNGELIVVGNKEDDETSTISFTGDFWIIKLQEN